MSDERYLRLTQIEGLSLAALRDLRVLVVGCGAIGNEVIKNLVLLGAGTVTMLDKDHVETHNLTRSVLLRESDVGAAKAEAVATHARALDPGVVVRAISGDLHDSLGPGLVREHDVIIGALDNVEARIRINQVCLLAGVPWVNAAIDSRHASVEVFPFGSDPGSACYECSLPPTTYARLAERMSCGGLLRAALAQQVMPTTILSTSVAGALAVGEALRLTGCDSRGSPEEAGAGASRIFFDTLAARSQRSQLSRAALCAGCGAQTAAAHWLGESRSLADALARFDDARGERCYALSDRIVWSCRCGQCGREPGHGAFVGRRAASLSDAITWCARCGTSSVIVDIRDQAEGHELREHFAGGLPDLLWLLDPERNAIVGFPARSRTPTNR